MENKKQRIMKAVRHEEPDKVPVIGFYGTWSLSLANETYKRMMYDLEIQKKIAATVLKDFTFDGVFEVGNGFPINIYQILGNQSYFISKDEMTLQHGEIAMLKNPEDYDNLINDFMGYSYNTLFKNKFPNLAESEKKSYETLKKAMYDLLGYYDSLNIVGEYVEKDLNTPPIVYDWVVSPVDMIFDYYRGFKDTMIDVRRRPEKIIETADKIADYQIEMLSKSFSGEEYPYFFIPIHCPTFMSKKQFETVYWPSFKKMSNFYESRNARIWYYWEGNCEHIYDFIQELPKNRIISALEKCDFVKAKKTIGQNTAILGGISTELLRAGTKEECINETKRIFDECAPGGGFLFSTDKILIAPNDVNSENYKAVVDFANKYGKY